MRPVAGLGKVLKELKRQSCAYIICQILIVFVAWPCVQGLPLLCHMKRRTGLSMHLTFVNPIHAGMPGNIIC